MFLAWTNKVLHCAREKSGKISTISCRLISLSGAGANAAGPPLTQLVRLNRMLSTSANASRVSETWHKNTNEAAARSITQKKRSRFNTEGSSVFLCHAATASSSGGIAFPRVRQTKKKSWENKKSSRPGGAGSCSLSQLQRQCRPCSSLPPPLPPPDRSSANTQVSPGCLRWEFLQFQPLSRQKRNTFFLFLLFSAHSLRS